MTAHEAKGIAPRLTRTKPAAVGRNFPSQVQTPGVCGPRLPPGGKSVHWPLYSLDSREVLGWPKTSFRLANPIYISGSVK